MRDAGNTDRRIAQRALEVVGGAAVGVVVFTLTSVLFFILYPMAFVLGSLASAAVAFLLRRRAPGGWWYVGCLIAAAIPAAYILWFYTVR